MKVIILSQIDYAGSAFKMFNAIKRHTEHDVNLFSGSPENKLKHPVNNIVTNQNRDVVQRLVNEADILHFKGDWPPINGYLGLKIPDKPIILTTSGSFFRKKEHKGLGRYSNADYGRVTLKTSFETDLLYPEYSDIWTPHPIDSDNEPVLWKQNKRPVFMHIPSSPNRKVTTFVQAVFDYLKKRISCETVIKTGITFKEAVELKKRSTIYFDQFGVGFYGNSALEAMQWGIPVVCWLSPWAIEQAKGQLHDCPIINENVIDPRLTAINVIEEIENKELSIRTKKWCDSHHGYRVIAKQWDTLYKSIA